MTAGAAALIVSAAAQVAGARPARADDTVAAPDRRLHVPLTLALGGIYLLAEAPFKGPLSKDTCRWCGPILVDDAVRDALLWGDRHLAHDLSNWSGFVTAPLFALGGIGLAAHLDDRRGNWFDDGLVIAEAAAIAGVTNFVIKAAVARERPFVHQLAPEDKPRTDRPQDNNQSFYSGHATLTMSLAVSAGTVASMRGYRWAPALWGGGVGLSLATGYLRIAADKHWTTDVVTGWVLGAAIGYAVPRFLHRRGTEVAPIATGSTVGVAMTW
ncbi:MAG: phosphatase PAP2 family protein [Kofleriaceae bacterium]|nr:phosphatase PAP2 family protein [Kofleriaceae bacterium]MCL4224806.1 phosphatase PAP2 family protein [Myxococcales bacterium]